MKKEITFCTYHNTYTNKRFYTDADVLDKLPEIGDYYLHDYRVSRISPAVIDTKQNSWVYDYNIYRVDLTYDPDHDGTPWDISNDETIFIAIPIEEGENDDE